MRAAFAAEQRAHDRDVQPGSGAVDHRVEQAVHHRPAGEHEVAAVLHLVDRVVVAKSALLLLIATHPVAQARAVDPPVDHLAQTPYDPGLGQGVCDLRQPPRVADVGEAVALLGVADPRCARRGRDVLVAVEHHLRAERRVATDLDRHMPPRRVEDVKRVVVDELPALLQVVDDALRGPRDLPHQRRRPGHQDQKHAHTHLRVLGQILLGDLMLALPGLAIDHRNAARLGGRANATREPAREPHQVRVVQLLIAIAVPSPPPHPEAAGRVPHRVIRVQDDPVRAVIAARQQIAAPLAEQVSHPPTLCSRSTAGTSRTPARLGRRAHPGASDRLPQRGHRFRAKSRTPE